MHTLHARFPRASSSHNHHLEVNDPTVSKVNSHTFSFSGNAFKSLSIERSTSTCIMHPTLRRSWLSRSQLPTITFSSRPFTSSAIRSKTGQLSTDSSVKTDSFPDDKHVTNKRDTLDVHSDASARGQQYVSITSRRQSFCIRRLSALIVVRGNHFA